MEECHGYQLPLLAFKTLCNRGTSSSQELWKTETKSLNRCLTNVGF